MARHRIERVNENLKRAISEIVVSELQDPRIGAATVTGVSAAPDLTLARVFVQVQGDESEWSDTFEGLEAATPFIRTLLADRVKMKRVPELRFEADRTMERAMRIERLLEEARRTEPDDAE